MSYYPSPQLSGSSSRQSTGEHLLHHHLHEEPKRSFGLTLFFVGIFTIVSLLYVGATAYWFFRDDILTAALHKQVAMRETYEERITLLRREIDKITSRQLLDQEAIEARIDQLVEQQAALSSRDEYIEALMDQAENAGLSLEQPPAPVARESDANITTGSITPIEGQHVSAATMALPVGPGHTRRSSNHAMVMAKLENSFQDIQAHQMSMVGLIERKARAEINSIGHALATIGITTQQVAKSRSARKAMEQYGTGGPLLPPKLSTGIDPAFKDNIASMQQHLAELKQLRYGLLQLPISSPMRNPRITSRFGNRVDPFTGRLAFHGGIDYGAPRGHRVRASGAGKVVHAGRKGGYGRMVEIDHGFGMTTRYAHLSRVSVKKGQWVEAGAVVGGVGSSGRSTGPHLHYEVRVSDNAVNPMRYLRAGKLVGPSIKN